MTATRPPAPASFVESVWTFGEILGRLPSFFTAVNEQSVNSARPASERMITSAMMGFMAVTATLAAPVVFAGGTAARAGEKLWARIDIFPEIAAKVQIFGESLAEQQRLLENFLPLHNLPAKTALIAKQAEQRADATEASARNLEELRTDYALKAPLLEQVDQVVAWLESSFAQTAGTETIRPGSLKETLFQERVQVLQKVSEEEQKLRALTARVQALMSRVQEKAVTLQRLEADMTILTRIKEGQFEGMQKEADSLPDQKPTTNGLQHVAVESMV